MRKIPNPSPGEILLEEFLKPLRIEPEKLALETFTSLETIDEILTGKRKLNADLALRFGKYFGNSPKFWLGIQDDFDLEEQKEALDPQLSTIKPI